ncbi:MAG: flavodoxin-dependent (E)-4-hydroxy-3-methylbut-2-enyl-diphosphate synthase [Caldisericota bacterium]|jgi:(E)-4-hydroxy-3-methylbut-2-enyl-diphosphate synthase|nr:flavodoxin-dependent (E)-4-hydroxy-3-methylbut-2-enyl-diphosphate synthase [Caldisericota bacterium]
MDRRRTRVVHVGGVLIGGDNPVVVQSMTKTDTKDIDATAAQIRDLTVHGCEIVRLAVKDVDAARALKLIKEQVGIPIVADIHFDARLALFAIESGVDKVRINPSNIKDKGLVRAVAQAARVAGIPIRVGANLGSMDATTRPEDRPQALATEALHEAALFEEEGFRDIVVSVKSSDVREMVEAVRIIATSTDYPLHLGVTEAGPLRQSLVKSSAGLAPLLLAGIGDTIRYSITGDPALEVDAAWALLAALGLRRNRPTIVSCPMCGRCEVVNLLALVHELEERLGEVHHAVTVALMGCVVNGVGEGKSADVGIACGKETGVLFIRGQAIRNVEPARFVDTLIAEANNLLTDRAPQ